MTEPVTAGTLAGSRGASSASPLPGLWPCTHCCSEKPLESRLVLQGMQFPSAVLPGALAQRAAKGLSLTTPSTLSFQVLPGSMPGWENT